MNKISIFILFTIVYLLAEIEANEVWDHRPPNTVIHESQRDLDAFGSDTLKAGWNQFMSAIRRPVKIKRLGKHGKLKTKTTAPNTTTPAPNTTITETISIPTSSLSTVILRKFGSSTTPARTKASTTVTSKSTVTTDLNEIFKLGINAIKQSVTETTAVPCTTTAASTTPITTTKEESLFWTVGQSKLRIPVISNPTWSSVYQWNNLQKPPIIEYRRKYHVRDPRVSFLPRRSKRVEVV